MNYGISLQEALTGFKTSITHLDGHKVTIDIQDNVIHCSQIYQVKNEGMPIKGSKGKFGDLYITFGITFPKRLTQGQKDLVRKALSG